ncbi:DUF1178 family protein [Rhizobium sp. C4]|uniref:DUF1178 family protein n=1 Tax=Rhizobium sp. C4 TaxID=1349800 RepID=UPI001E57E4C0|nr:DUF1178 family protein [Rhizobium sp. C4]MCD2175735.1 DUF1178 family protein [Rhizobium sp. C4]
MIKYSLKCEAEHAFEGWFSSGSDFDAQQARGLVTCPVCGSASVSKALMAPAVTTAQAGENDVPMAMAAAGANPEMLAKLREIVTHIRANSEDVGARFPEEARKIHYGEAPARGIIGEAKQEEIGALLEEGIEIAPLPVLPEDTN